jgi:hypothetical protein
MGTKIPQNPKTMKTMDKKPRAPSPPCSYYVNYYKTKTEQKSAENCKKQQCSQPYYVISATLIHTIFGKSPIFDAKNTEKVLFFLLKIRKKSPKALFLSFYYSQLR